MAGIKVKDFFNGRFFVIPKYQRGYAWEIHNVNDLFDDIVESIESNSNHYIGTIVLSKSEDDEEEYYVVDGQQRITTLTLLINALVKVLPDKDASFYERFYLKEDGRYRISPLNRDKDFLMKLLDGGSFIPEPQNKSQRFLKEAAEQISYKVRSIEDKLKFLKSVEKLEVMEFVENSEGDAIRIFQTVNDRGKPLSSMEKAKSLLIYFSNRYLNKELDNIVNDHFSDMFEIYDDIKHQGEELGITLITNKDFNEDNLMRYHFVTYSNENYDPTAKYVLQFLKSELDKLRSGSGDSDYSGIKNFISSYIESLKGFFTHCKNVIEKAKSEIKYFKLFVILNLSATLYPLIVKLEMVNLLEAKLVGDGITEFSFLDLLELIEVRVYKTRATDPKADIAKLVFEIDNKSALQIEESLLWFNHRWMSKEEFQSYLYGSIYGNRALNHIFITKCEQIKQRDFKIEELKKIVLKIPTIEHILAQTPKFAPRALGFKNSEDFIDYEHTIGNLTLLEKSLNSRAQHKNAIEKVDIYGESKFDITRQLASDIDTQKTFKKTELTARTKELADFCIKRWWV